jgi:hypothetical protein
MAAAALITGSVMAFVLGRQLLGALAGARTELTATERAARERIAKERRAAEKAKAAAKDADRELARTLKAAAERVKREEQGEAPKAKPPQREAPPAPAEPGLWDVQLGDAQVKPAADTLAQAGDEKPTKRQWAEQLYTYALREIREGRASGLGTKGAPNARVKAAQDGMGKLAPDGIYGDKTRARGKELTGKTFPERTQPKAKPPTASPLANLPVIPGLFGNKPAAAPAAKPPQRPIGPRPGSPVPQAAVAPAKRSPVQAARDLLAYASDLIGDGKASQLGNVSKPNAFVMAAQADMGELKSDGIYGLKTRQRGKALTGETFPARV